MTDMPRPALRRFLDGIFCGCGSPEAAAAALLRLLDTHDSVVSQRSDPVIREPLREWITDGGVRLLLLYFCDAHGLIEHGTVVEGSWLTVLGVQIRDALRREQADGFAALFRDACSHGYDIDDPSHNCAHVRP